MDFLHHFWVVTSFGRPLRCSSWYVVRPRLNFTIQYYIVVNEGTDLSPPSRILLGFDIGWTETFQMRVCYITVTNFFMFTNSPTIDAVKQNKQRVVFKLRTRLYKDDIFVHRYFSNNNCHKKVTSDTSGTALVRAEGKSNRHVLLQKALMDFTS